VNQPVYAAEIDKGKVQMLLTDPSRTSPIDRYESRSSPCRGAHAAARPENPSRLQL
jgi:hypothetical protein